MMPQSLGRESYLPPLTLFVPVMPERTTVYGELARWVDKVRAALSLQDSLECCEALAVRARLTPLDAQGRPRESRDVRLREFSERSVAFEHPAPLAERRALMSLESPQLGTLAAEVDLSWCRYVEGGRYASGGRFRTLLDPSE
jgi:hypothetical protein